MRRGAEPKRRRVAGGGPTDHALLWRALASPVRRRILRLLALRPHTTSELGVALPERLSRFAVMQHLAVLEGAGVVVSVRHGRARYNHLNPTPLHRLAHTWFRRFERLVPPPLLRFKRSDPQRGSPTGGLSRSGSCIPDLGGARPTHHGR